MNTPCSKQFTILVNPPSDGPNFNNLVWELATQDQHPTASGTYVGAFVSLQAVTDAGAIGTPSTIAISSSATPFLTYTGPTFNCTLRVTINSNGPGITNGPISILQDGIEILGVNIADVGTYPIGVTTDVPFVVAAGTNSEIRVSISCQAYTTGFGGDFSFDVELIPNY